jgi:hypothetical protein
VRDGYQRLPRLTGFRAKIARLGEAFWPCRLRLNPLYAEPLRT